ncbi:MAG TPA: tannase/feruloyl esterase family alpha/beta hydrolase [Bryobacteraceae bacterium]|nr:tannase/feruloyl esterase family alpha/beta hydrolase [Bryobacteraceae bacterium]
MPSTQTMQNRTTFSAVLAAAILMPAVTAPLRAQAFADLKTAVVDYSHADLGPRAACEALGKFKSKEIAEIAATTMPATADVPAHCRVTGVLSPEIAFEVSLPAKWNGRFYMIGNGGHAGEAMDDPGRVAQRNAALQLGFAFAQTNTGHDARKEPGATFVMSNPQKAIDYAYRAVHLTAKTTKSITKEYYGKAVARAYWNSCSNGGRQGLIEAQRFPDDFDGIVANAPWVDQTGFTIGAMWNEKALSEAPGTPAKLALVGQKVMEKCDAIDGLKDGLIDDPRKCNFDPARDVAACKEGTDGPDCLTAAQAAAIAKVYSGPVSNGKPFFPGYMPGSEAVMPNLFGGGTGSGWMNLIATAQPDGKPADFNLAEGTMRYLVNKPPKPDYDYRTFDFDRDIHLLDDWSKQADAKDPDLGKFKKRGGKLLMTYGWADSILQPMMGVNYYEQALTKNGPDTMQFFRLFMVPGMAHCGGGIGPDRNDSMTAMIDWVEKGKAPDSIVASRVVNNQVVRTRPLCPYPQVARYSGSGSIDEAANFACVAPTP